MSRRSVSHELENVLSNMVTKMNPKIEPRQTDTTNEQNFTQDTKMRRMYSIWIWLRQHYGLSDYNSKNNQIVPSFAGN